MSKNVFSQYPYRIGNEFGAGFSALFQQPSAVDVAVCVPEDFGQKFRFVRVARKSANHGHSRYAAAYFSETRNSSAERFCNIRQRVGGCVKQVGIGQHYRLAAVASGMMQIPCLFYSFSGFFRVHLSFYFCCIGQHCRFVVWCKYKIQRIGAVAFGVYWWKVCRDFVGIRYGSDAVFGYAVRWREEDRAGQ